MSKILSSPKTSQLASPPDSTESPGANQNRDSRYGWLWIFLGCIAALAFRVYVLSEPLWLDELHTAWVVDCEFQEVASRAAIGNQAPVYFWIVWCVTSAWQLSEFSLRILSMVAGVLLVAVSGRLVFCWTKSVPAVVTAVLLLAIDPTCIFYATEARPYGFLQFCAVIQLGFFWRGCNRILDSSENNTPWPSIIQIALTSALLFYIHYTAVLLLAAEFIFVLAVFLARQPRQANFTLCFNLFVKSAVLTVILCVPAAINLISVVIERKSNWQAVSSGEVLIQDLAGPITFSLLVPLVCLVVTFVFNHGKREAAFYDHTILLLAIGATIPVQFAYAGDYWNIAPLALSRYLVCSVLIMFLFAATVVGMFRGKRTQWAIATLFVLMNLSVNPICHSIANSRSLPNFRHENWLDPIAQINADGNQNLPVFLFGNVLEDADALSRSDRDFQAYLKFPVAGIYKINHADRIFPMPSNRVDPFGAIELERLNPAGGWMLFRAQREAVQQTLAQLQSRIPNCNYDSYQSPDSDVILIKFYNSRN